MPRPARLAIRQQPDGSSCGPTCLEAVYRWHGDLVSVEDIAAEVPRLSSGGTLGVQLACHALQRGYAVDLYTFNLVMFDPTWFSRPGVDVAAKLEKQRSLKTDSKLHLATDAYLEFLRLGGRLDMCDPAPLVLEELLSPGFPIIAGLSSTWLYGDSRETDDDDPQDDDVGGVPQGHFVVLGGWDQESGEVTVADPYRPNPFSSEPIYTVEAGHLIASLLLGIVTYDANLLIIRPREGDAK